MTQLRNTAWIELQARQARLLVEQGGRAKRNNCWRALKPHSAISSTTRNCWQRWPVRTPTPATPRAH